MIEVRKSKERGHIQHGWLDTYHSFSFAEYYDPQNMGFRSLRVINEDHILGGAGFPMHAHRDMEIITYVIEGTLEHKDSMGNGSVIKAGDVQRMSAGTGVQHSEFNHSENDDIHLFQIWILPEKKSLKPSYDQKNFTKQDKTNVFKLLASHDGQNGSLSLHQDVKIYATLLGAKQKVSMNLDVKRFGWVQVASGEVKCNGQILEAGDGARLSAESKLVVEATSDSEFLFFDLA